MNNLYTQAGIQDSLLQSYRSFQLTMQSIFIAIGGGLAITNIRTGNFTDSLLIFIVFIPVASLALFSLIKIRNVILSRGKDVDYWHNKIIEAEKKLDSDKKYLTRFKIYQKFHRQNIDDSEFRKIELNNKALEKLTEKGKGHTRKVIDTYLFSGFLLTWIIFILVSSTTLIINYTQNGI